MAICLTAFSVLDGIRNRLDCSGSVFSQINKQCMVWIRRNSDCSIRVLNRGNGAGGAIECHAVKFQGNILTFDVTVISQNPQDHGFIRRQLDSFIDNCRSVIYRSNINRYRFRCRDTVLIYDPKYKCIGSIKILIRFIIKRSIWIYYQRSIFRIAAGRN